MLSRYQDFQDHSVAKPETEFLGPEDIRHSLQRAEEIHRERTSHEGWCSMWREEVGRTVIQNGEGNAATVVRTSRTEFVELDETGDLGRVIWTARDNGTLAEAIARWVEA